MPLRAGAKWAKDVRNKGKNQVEIIQSVEERRGGRARVSGSSRGSSCWSKAARESESRLQEGGHRGGWIDSRRRAGGVR